MQTGEGFIVKFQSGSVLDFLVTLSVFDRKYFGMKVMLIKVGKLREEEKQSHQLESRVQKNAAVFSARIFFHLPSS